LTTIERIPLIVRVAFRPGYLEAAAWAVAL
jgi:uncharacterized protein involved in response to NO